MKLTGAVLIFLSLSAAGMTASTYLKKREAAFEAILSFLCSFKIELEYSALPIEVVIGKYAGERALCSASFLKACNDEMKNGTDFPLAWEVSVKTMNILLKSEKEKLFQLGCFLGTSDAAGQINMLCIYEKYFGDYLEKARRASEKYSKAFVLLGLFSGFGAFILII